MEGKRASEKLYYLNVVVKIQQETLHAAISRSHPISIWHQRLGHTNHRTILNMVNQKAVDGLNLDREHTTPSSAPTVSKERCMCKHFQPEELEETVLVH